MYRVMQVGSSGEVIELPQIVTGNFNTGTTQQAIINPLNCNCLTLISLLKSCINLCFSSTSWTVLHCRSTSRNVTKWRNPPA